jgi:hypothetical protein
MSERKYVYPNAGNYTARVKVVDVFGREASVDVEIRCAQDTA